MVDELIAEAEAFHDLFVAAIVAQRDFGDA